MTVFVHLLVDARPLCGAPQQLLGTRRPKEVTCAQCRALLGSTEDADARAREARRPDRRRGALATCFDALAPKPS